MLKFFDFVYWKLCKMYLSTIDSSPEFSSVCVISLLETASILIILEIYATLNNDKDIFNKTFGILLYCGFAVFNYIRYIYSEQYNYKKLQEKWEIKSQRFQKINRVLLITYIVLTIPIFVGLAIYLGSR